MITSKDPVYNPEWKQDLEDIIDEFRGDVEAELEYRRELERKRKGGGGINKIEDLPKVLI